MQVYSKKSLFSGLILLSLGVLNVVTSIIYKNFEFKDLIIILALLFLGSEELLASFKQKTKIEEIDERNQLLDLKTTKLVLHIMQVLMFLFGTGLLVGGKIYDISELTILGVGLEFILGLSFLIEVGVRIFYELKN